MWRWSQQSAPTAPKQGLPPQCPWSTAASAASAARRPMEASRRVERAKQAGTHKAPDGPAKLVPRDTCYSRRRLVTVQGLRPPPFAKSTTFLERPCRTTCTLFMICWLLEVLACSSIKRTSQSVTSGGFFRELLEEIHPIEECGDEIQKRGNARTSPPSAAAWTQRRRRRRTRPGAVYRVILKRSTSTSL